MRPGRSGRARDRARRVIKDRSGGGWAAIPFSEAPPSQRPRRDRRTRFVVDRTENAWGKLKLDKTISMGAPTAMGQVRAGAADLRPAEVFSLDGRRVRGTAAPAGLYLLRMETARGITETRILSP